MNYDTYYILTANFVVSKECEGKSVLLIQNQTSSYLFSCVCKVQGPLLASTPSSQKPSSPNSPYTLYLPSPVSTLQSFWQQVKLGERGYHRCVFSPLLFFLYTTSVPQETCLFNLCKFHMTQQSSSWPEMKTSQHRDKSWNSWDCVVVTTTCSWTRSKLWRWQLTLIISITAPLHHTQQRFVSCVCRNQIDADDGELTEDWMTVPLT